MGTLISEALITCTRPYYAKTAFNSIYQLTHWFNLKEYQVNQLFLHVTIAQISCSPLLPMRTSIPVLHLHIKVSLVCISVSLRWVDCTILHSNHNLSSKKAIFMKASIESKTYLFGDKKKPLKNVGYSLLFCIIKPLLPKEIQVTML